jgi:micrococcal nuclease
VLLLAALPPAPAGGRETRSAAPAGPAAVKVIGITDGDTIEVLDRGRSLKVRLYGIDCPELSQSFGRRARMFASDLAFGRQVTLRTKGRDAYRRTLAEVILPDGRSLNSEMVGAGLAWVYRRYTDDPALLASEKEARKRGLGLWADPDPVPPWDFRRKRKGG